MLDWTEQSIVGRMKYVTFLSYSEERRTEVTQERAENWFKTLRNAGFTEFRVKPGQPSFTLPNGDKVVIRLIRDDQYIDVSFAVEAR